MTALVAVDGHVMALVPVVERPVQLNMTYRARAALVWQVAQLYPAEERRGEEGQKGLGGLFQRPDVLVAVSQWRAVSLTRLTLDKGRGKSLVHSGLGDCPHGLHHAAVLGDASEDSAWVKHLVGSPNKGGHGDPTVGGVPSEAALEADRVSRGQESVESCAVGSGVEAREVVEGCSETDAVVAIRLHAHWLRQGFE
jgi:hypothetical protein